MGKTRISFFCNDSKWQWAKINTSIRFTSIFFAILLLSSVLVPFGVVLAVTTFVDSLVVSGQENTPRGIAFNTDGTKMFVVGPTSDRVHEYTCTTGFDVSTCTDASSPSIDFSALEPNAEDLAFNTDGTKMFVLGGTNDLVHEFACTAFDVSTCTDSSSPGPNVSDTDVSSTGLAFNTDGTKMFIVGVNELVGEYDCGTGFDVSTCSANNDRSLNIDAQDPNPHDITFNNDGTKMFILGENADNVEPYTCTTGFLVTSCTYAGNDQRFSVLGEENQPTGMAFSADGLKMFVVGLTGKDVNEYTLEVAFDFISAPTAAATTSNNSGDSTAPTLGTSSTGQKLIDNGFVYNDNPVDVKNFKTHYPLVRTPVGEKNTLDLKIFENQGMNALKFVSVHFGVPQIHAQGEAIVTYYPGTKVMKVHDPNNLLGDVEIDLKPVKCKDDSQKTDCVNVSLDHTFNEAPLYDMIRVTLADKKLNHADVFFNDGIEVFGDSLNPANTAQIAAQGKDRGLLELTQTDRAQEIWVDQYDNIWTKNSMGNFIMKPLDEFTHPDDNPVSENGYKRMNSHFDTYKSGQELVAKQIWDSSTIQSELPESFETPAYGFILDENNPVLRTNDPVLQAEIINQIYKAEQKWDSQTIQMFSEDYVIIEIDEISSLTENNPLQDEKIIQVIIAQDLLNSLYDTDVSDQTNELQFNYAANYVPAGKIKEDSSYIDNVRWTEFEKAKQILDEEYDPTRFFKYN